MEFIKKNFGVLLVVLLGIVPIIGLFHPGLPVTHDGRDQVARMANFYLGLSEGVVVPRWGALLNWGYGHPVLMFLYPFSSYTSSLFHFLGFSLTDSIKIVFGLGFVSSGIAMYLWARNAFSEYVGIAAGILYMFAPYRFVDLYVRGALGEHTAFIFPPLILYFLYKFFVKKSTIRNDYWYFLGIALSTASLLLSHNAISVMFFPIIVLYTIYLWHTTQNNRKLIQAGIGLFLGVLLSSFFLIPALIEGKYTLRDIVIGNEYENRFVVPWRFIWSSWNYGITNQFSNQLGLLQLAGVVMSPFVVYTGYKNKKKFTILLGAIFVLFLISIFLQIKLSDFAYNIFTILKNFQFPWRFLSMSVFTTAILTSSIFLVIKSEKTKKIALGLLVVGALLVNGWFMHANAYLSNPDSFYYRIYPSTTDTGESSPIWSVRFMEKVPNSEFEIIDGKATIEKLSRTTIKHSYRIQVEKQTRFMDNTLYFPGWTVYANNNPVSIEFQDQAHRGLITFNLPEGNYIVDVVFKDTKLRMLSNMFSVVAFVTLLGIGVYTLRKK